MDTTIKPVPKRRLTRLVFTTPTGRPLRRTRFDEQWRALTKKIDLPKDTTFHDLRHYYASLLIAHGESIKVVHKRLGHGDF